MFSWNSKQVLVTGGLGFVGSNLARRMVEEGATIRILDIVRSEEKLSRVDDIDDDITIVDADIRDSETVSEQVKEADLVYHLASKNSRLDANDEPYKNLDINCGGLLNVLETAAAIEDSPRVVYASSLATVGNPPGPIDESTQSPPVDIYGTHKQTAEDYCRLFNRLKGVPTTVVRPANIYGPRAPLHDTGYGVINQFIGAALRDEPLKVFEPGDTTRDFVYIMDLVNCLLLLGREADAIGEKYVLGTGKATSIKELAQLVIDIAGGGSIEYVPWPDEWDQIRRGNIVTNPSKLKHQLGWVSTVELEDGIRKAVEFYRENQNNVSQEGG